MTNPDFRKLADAFGTGSAVVGSADELERCIRRALEARLPTIIEVPYDPRAMGPTPPHTMWE